MSYHLHILLRSNRWAPAALIVRDLDNRDVDFAPCKGKADNKQAAAQGNPERDPLKPYGDTPTGTYAPTRLVRFEEPHPVLGDAWIPIEGASGDASEALLVGKRSGLGIHAGRGEKLMATYGCLRLRQSDFDRIAKLVEGHDLTVIVKEVD